MWDFHQQFGFQYPAGKEILSGMIQNGYLMGCTTSTINKNGGLGSIEGRYEDATLKILVFGDSWTATPQNRRTWTNFLQSELSSLSG